MHVLGSSRLVQVGSCQHNRASEALIGEEGEGVKAIAS
jgi:hypothetical protein